MRTKVNRERKGIAIARFIVGPMETQEVETYDGKFRFNNNHDFFVEVTVKKIK